MFSMIYLCLISLCLRNECCVSFKKSVACGGSVGCNMEAPSASIPLAEIYLQRTPENMTNLLARPCSKMYPVVLCAYFCRIDNICIGFNFRNDSSICETFISKPKFLQQSKQCEYYHQDIGQSDNLNLALGKMACQSSTFQGNEQLNGAWRSVDGELGSNSSSNGCSITALSYRYKSWIMVDLDQSYHVAYILLYTPIEDDIMELDGFQVKLQEHPLDWSFRTIGSQGGMCFKTYETRVYQYPYRIDCQPGMPIARYVVLSNIGPMFVCELEIYS